MAGVAVANPCRLRHEVRKVVLRLRVIAAFTLAVEYAAAGPDMAVTKLRASQKLPRHPTTGALFPLLSPTAELDALGGGVASYFLLLDSWRNLLWLLFLLALSNMVTNIYGNGLEGDERTMFTAPSIANVRVLPTSYGVMEFVLGGVMAHACFESLYKLRKQQQQMNVTQDTAADFALLLTGLPVNAGEPAFAQRLTRAMDETIARQTNDDALPAAAGSTSRVAYYSVAYRSRTAVTLSSEREEATARCEAVEIALGQRRLHGLRAPGVDAARQAALGREADRLRRRLQRLDWRLNALVREEAEACVACCGIGFVGFDDADDARTVLAKCDAGGGTLHLEGTEASPGCVLRVRRPPEPSDVCWENLGVPWWEACVRQALISSFMLGMALVGTGLILVGQNLFPAMIARFVVEDAGSAVARMALQLSCTACILLGNVPIFALVPLLENSVARHATFASKELTITLKLLCFQCFNTVASSFTFAYFETSGSYLNFNRHWYVHGGALVVNALIGDLIIINLVVDLLQPGALIQRLVATRTELTQRGMDQAYAVPRDLYLAFRLQLALKFVVLSLMYGAAFPLLYFIGWMFLVLAPFVDRWNLLRVFCSPAESDHTLALGLQRVVPPLAVLLHLIMTELLFSDLHKGEAQHAPGGAVQDGALQGNASSSEAEYAAAEGSARFWTHLSLYVHGSSIVYYILREWGRASTTLCRLGRKLRRLVSCQSATARQASGDLNEHHPVLAILAAAIERIPVILNALARTKPGRWLTSQLSTAAPTLPATLPQARTSSLPPVALPLRGGPQRQGQFPWETVTPRSGARPHSRAALFASRYRSSDCARDRTYILPPTHARELIEAQRPTAGRTSHPHAVRGPVPRLPPLGKRATLTSTRGSGRGSAIMSASLLALQAKSTFVEGGDGIEIAVGTGWDSLANQVRG